jgi:hypothetical protein
MSRFRREEGFAMITAILVSVVVLSFSLVVVDLSVHNSTTSSFDRDRVQAINAAEAGIDVYLSSLSGAVGAATCNPVSADLPTVPKAHYDVTIQLYSAWPPAPGSEMTCPPATGVDPAGALVTSKGSTLTAGLSAVARTMETAVRLTPVYGGLGQAIFSNNQLNIQNKLTLNGYKANDGDVYTNGDYNMANNTVIGGTVYAQGYAFINQGVVKQDVWANSYVDLHNLSVLGKATSSTSYVKLDNAHVYGDAKAGTTITLSNNSIVGGNQTPNSPSGAPPTLAFPQMTYDPNAWIKAGYVPVTYTSCLLAKAFINSGPKGNYVVRITPACALSWSSSEADPKLQGNMAIITDGSVTLQNNRVWTGINGGPYNLFFIRPYQTGLVCGGIPSYDFTASNQTSFTNLNLLVYTQCTINFGNNNSNGVNGQLIGGQVNITNQMVLNYVPITVPAFNLTGYLPEVSYLREIPHT